MDEELLPKDGLCFCSRFKFHFVWLYAMFIG